MAVLLDTRYAAAYVSWRVRAASGSVSPASDDENSFTPVRVCAALAASPDRTDSPASVPPP